MKPGSCRIVYELVRNESHGLDRLQVSYLRADFKTQPPVDRRDGSVRFWAVAIV